MTTINLRGNLTQALTAGELDGNFTTLGLEHGMTTSNVAIGVNTVTSTDIDVSGQIVINETSGQETARNSNFPDTHLFVYAPDYRDFVVLKQGTNVNAKTAMTYHRTLEADMAAGLGAGIFAQFTTNDVTTPDFLGGWDFSVNNFTDTDNFDTKWAPYVYATASGTRASYTPIAIEHDNIEANVPVQLKSYSDTERDALTNVHNGQLIYNTTDNKVQARANGVWVDLH